MPLFSIPRTRPDAPVELRGPCRKRSRGSVVVDAQMLERRGRFETFPYRLRAEKLSMVFLLATGLEPLAISSPRTTYYVPRTLRADTRVRPYGEMTRHEPQATSHMPPFRHSNQASLWLARASPDRRHPHRAWRARGNYDYATETAPRPLTRSWAPAFAGVTGEDARSVRGSVNRVLELYT